MPFSPLFLGCSAFIHAKSHPALSDPMDYNPPGSSVHGLYWTRIMEARILEWVAMPSN